MYKLCVRFIIHPYIYQDSNANMTLHLPKPNDKQIYEICQTFQYLTAILFVFPRTADFLETILNI